MIESIIHGELTIDKALKQAEEAVSALMLERNKNI